MGNATGRASRQALQPPAEVSLAQTSAGPSSSQDEDPVRSVRTFFDEFLGDLRRKFQERARGLHLRNRSPFWPFVDVPEPAPGTDRFEPADDPVFLALLEYLIETTFREGLGCPLSRGLVDLFLRFFRGEMTGLEGLCHLAEEDAAVTETRILALGGKLIGLGQNFRAAGIKWKGVLRVDRRDDDSSRPAGSADDEGRSRPGLTIGIDLGTSCTRAAADVNGFLESLLNDKGKEMTPSWVAYTEERLIGEDAQNQALVNPEGTIFNAKRLIGRKFRDIDVREDSSSAPYEIVNEHGKPYIKVKSPRGEWLGTFSPEDIVAVLLGKIKEDAGRALNMIITDAVVTVPVCFNAAQRQATKDACEKAHLNLVRLINEPTAAAIAYGRYKQVGQRNILVCHLGGGTFDVSVLIIDNGAFVVLATSGDKLGGQDFDKTIMWYFINLIYQRHGRDISRDNRALAKLRRECERAKEALGSQLDVQVEIESLCEGLDFSELLTRDQFEELNDDFFMKIVWHVNKTMNDARLNNDQIDDVVLTGGSSRIPKFRQMLREYFNGKEPDMEVNLDEAARDGAAIIGGTLSGNCRDDTKDILILDVVPPTPENGAMNILMHRNIMIPTVEYEDFTAESSQVIEEERRLREDQGCLITRVVRGLVRKCWQGCLVTWVVLGVVKRCWHRRLSWRWCR